ncbi:Sec-independent protein translocase protein TatB homolog [Gordonia effusa NBRC 100432]|uniref:Sec-independent protein translocase protein TatB n=1 Tax=Gordonia effusa NBRC 100432 TaxID=1077974 RepID=H0QVV5_9ACTN|nr:Sec-independent protein translocase protein TatB [Gordonia effusa]GAB16956.1 Sec-independent protein translocase protein TatB homolog [Gordonia effusa NBRC 100432]
MFNNIGGGEILIILAAGLIILGPERLPGAVSWTFKSLRQVRDYATGATSQLKGELGPEFEDLRKPLADLNELRGMTPTGFVTKHLLDGDSSLLSPKTYFDDEKSSAPTPSLSKSAPASSVDMSKSASAPAQPAKPRHDVSEWDAT